MVSILSELPTAVRKLVPCGLERERLLDLISSMEYHYNLAMSSDNRAAKSMSSYRTLSAEFDAELAAHCATNTKD